MVTKNIGGYTIGIEYNEHSYSEAYTVWVFINGQKMLLSKYSESDYKKLTDKEIIDMAKFRQQMSNAYSRARNSLWGI